MSPIPGFVSFHLPCCYNPFSPSGLELIILANRNSPHPDCAESKGKSKGFNPLAQVWNPFSDK